LGKRLYVYEKLGKAAMVLGGVRNGAASSVEVRKGSYGFRRNKECGCMFRRSWEMNLWFEE
jgi:hypothetical protein